MNAVLLLLCSVTALDSAKLISHLESSSTTTAKMIANSQAAEVVARFKMALGQKKEYAALIGFAGYCKFRVLYFKDAQRICREYLETDEQFRNPADTLRCKLLLHNISIELGHASAARTALLEDKSLIEALKQNGYEFYLMEYLNLLMMASSELKDTKAVVQYADSMRRISELEGSYIKQRKSYAIQHAAYYLLINELPCNDMPVDGIKEYLADFRKENGRTNTPLVISNCLLFSPNAPAAYQEFCVDVLKEIVDAYSVKIPLCRDQLTNYTRAAKALALLHRRLGRSKEADSLLEAVEKYRVLAKEQMNLERR